MVDIYRNIEDYNPNKKGKIFIVFDNLVTDMFSNKNLSPILTELFITGRKLDISHVFITQSYFAVLNCTHHFIMKSPNKQEINKLYPKINQISTFRTLLILIKNVLQNHISF